MKRLSNFLSLICVILIGTSVAYSDTFRNKNDQNVAINGFDTVAYFSNSRAVMGQSDYQVQHAGAIWYFSSQKNKNIFEQNPPKYTPQFAGHCANGLSDGHLVLADPSLFRVIDGKLYLFFSKWGRAQWAMRQSSQIALAEQNWTEFKTSF
ncbi:YHS domain-containing (seleno)protein [Reinekea marina]|uniref:YHS domain-containing (Seleno)protein n=1 Tax=Reinekea marina TaxID=1310421 RepID=A0ABV7WNR8_9GAMM